MIEVFGARVRQARVLRRMSATSVCESMGWSPNRQTKLEKSSVLWSTPEEVERFSDLFGFPARFFSTEPRTRLTAGELLFRAPKSMTKGEQEFLAVFASLVGDILGDLDDHSKLPPVRVPAIQSGPSAGVPIALAALQLREAMGLEADEPFDDLMYEAERVGAPVIVRRRERGEWDSEFAASAAYARTERHLGYSSWVGEHRDRPLLVLRESESWERTRFTVAHELGHLVLHSRASCLVGSEQESEADRFAAELLAPIAAVATELPTMMSLLNLKPLKDKWGISLGALIRHIRDARLIDPVRAEMLTKQLYSRTNPDTGHTWGVTEPGWLDRQPERPRLISKFVERCYGAMSLGELAAQGTTGLPLDVLDWILATQRTAPSLPIPQSPNVTIRMAATHGEAEVVALDSRRHRA